MHEKLNHVDYQLAPVYRWTAINLETQMFDEDDQIHFFCKKKEEEKQTNWTNFVYFITKSGGPVSVWVFPLPVCP